MANLLNRLGSGITELGRAISSNYRDILHYLRIFHIEDGECYFDHRDVNPEELGEMRNRFDKLAKNHT
ncbi:hypothetical protein HYW76_03530 [Candidatus Pacearchaeota archaeon]|nr:hypothetical protein [Candidatus Pacearchaeota archaeon]